MPSALKLEDLSVMIVEDDAFTRSLIKQVIRGLGVRTVVEADSAVKALEILATSAIDVIVSDIEMSPIDGLQFLRHLRTGSRSEGFAPGGIPLTRAAPSQIPVIFLTAHAQVKLVEKARAAGVSAFLTKPVRPALLRDRLQSVMPMVRRQEAAPVERPVPEAQPEPADPATGTE